jgi:hypothetical protein
MPSAATLSAYFQVICILSGRLGHVTELNVFSPRTSLAHCPYYIWVSEAETIRGKYLKMFNYGPF